MWVAFAFAMQKILTFFSKNINVFAIFQDRNLNVTLDNNFVKFEQLGPDKYFFFFTKSYILELIYVEAPLKGPSNEYVLPQHLFLWSNKKVFIWAPFLLIAV